MDEAATVENIPPRASKIFWIVFTPVLGALAYSFLYLTGAIYSETLLNHYGVPTHIFPKSPTDHMLDAYSALLQTGLNWINVVKDLKIVLSALALVALFLAEIALLNLLQNSRFAKKASTLAEAKRPFRILIAIAVISGSIVITLFSIPLFLNIILLAPALVGVKAAERVYERADSIYAQGCANVKKLSDSCVTVYDADQKIASGFLIISSPTHLALYLNDKTTILPVKDYRIETIPPTPHSQSTES